ncbi:ThuA domain-containing protein, partial [Aquiflexum sp.]|uniref:ThuA domain-containing protein n=1 Tax=Aquiflexum sp. TaxID=1872584 RepID=UPI003594258F
FIFEDSDVVIEGLAFTNCPSEPLTVGDTIDLDVLITPSNTTNQTIAFTAIDGTSVNYLSGEFVASTPGEITVTATSLSDGSVFAFCTIIIQDNASSFDPYSFVQAEDFSTQTGIQLSNSGAAVGYVNNGDYIQFDNVTFGRGPLSGQIIASSNATGGIIEFRTGSPDGILIATAEISNTGGWLTFQSFDIEVVDPESYADGTVYLGDESLYLVFKGGSGYLLDVDRFIFEDSDVVIEGLAFTNCPSEPLTVGDTIDLDVLINPSNTTNQTIAFTASDGTSVNYLSGEFVASTPGEIKVTATSLSYGSVFTQCIISIIEAESTKNLNILIYHETNGFRHGSINDGINMVNEFATDLNWTVTDSRSSEVFNGTELSQFDVVIWMNTSGDDLLTLTERNAFEAYIKNGGGFVGVHAATDTYRDGSWPWYNDLVGAIVQTSPNHTANNTNATIDVVGIHPAVAHLKDMWNKNEEYYYWKLNGGYLYSGNIDLLRVRSTGGNSYDEPRPITWYKLFDGGRSFYTALGHNGSDFSNNIEFRTMMKEAILWAGGGNEPMNSAKSETQSEYDLLIFPNPASSVLNISEDNFKDDNLYAVHILTIEGVRMMSQIVSKDKNELNISRLGAGTYLVIFEGSNQFKRQLLRVK